MKVEAGKRIYDLCSKLFPICRSITGNGVRETLKIIDQYISLSGFNLKITEVPTGTKVFDWTVPKEWVINDAYIEDESGNHLIDFKNNNLHVMGYSAPLDIWVDRSELGEYVFTQPDQPDWIPYVTSYYKEQSGFCMSEHQLESIPEGKYHLVCNSKLIEGSLTYAEVLIPGESDKEILINSYICHPSMANNECSGPSLSSELIRYLAGLKERKFSYRFVFTPETIGSITYISKNLDHIKKHVVLGYNLTCCGDDRGYFMVNTPDGDTMADRVMENVLYYKGKYEKYPFLRAGSEERRYNAPGVDVPMVCFGRSLYGEYPEYHTSADDMGLVSPAGFQGSYEVMSEVIQSIEKNETYRIKTICEPQLGKRGLYASVSKKGMYDDIMPMMNLISYANGYRDLIEISNIIKIPMWRLIGIVELLKKHDLLELISS